MANRAAFLKLARARWKQATEADTRQIGRELEALRFYAGEQWDKDLLDSRKGSTLGSGSGQQVVPARPSLVINKTREPVSQILNQERASEFTVELVPADDWGDTTGPVNHAEIELREGLVRRIQRDSEAADARSWAFERAVIAGRGYWLVNTRFVPGKRWDQEVYLHRIYNQASVVLNADHEQPDGSDARWGFIGSDLPIDQYTAEHGTRNGKPNRLTQRDLSDSEWRALGDEAPDWFVSEKDTRFVRVVDYYYEVLKPRTLCLLKDGSCTWQSELPPDVSSADIQDRRTVIDRTIKWAKIDGCNDDVLEETEWPGHYLPIIKVVGEELQPYDKERRCEGIVQTMEDSCRGFNYITSKFVERVGLTPIPPIVMAGGQDEGYESEWNAMNTRTLGRLHYNQKDSFGVPASPPFRPDSRAEIADLAMGVQMFNDAIVSTSRVPETALGHLDPSVKSGKLAKALIQQGEQSTSNYLDNLKRSMRHEARVINDLLYPIYGKPGRLARLMNPAGDMQTVPIGVPFVQGPTGQPQQVPAGHPESKTYTLTPDAEFNVAVSIARASDTRRKEIADMLARLIDASPEQLGVIGDLLWKFSDAPEHEELEQRYRAVLIPPIQAMLSGKAQIPPELQAQLAQLQQKLQELQPLADKNQTELQKTQIHEQAETARSAADGQIQIQKTVIQSTAQEAIAQSKTDAENFRSYVDASESKVAQMLDLHFKAVTDQLARTHEHVQNAIAQTHERQMATVNHQQALEQGQQAAALAPPADVQEGAPA